MLRRGRGTPREELGVWDKLASPRRQFTIREKIDVRRLLSRANTTDELVSEVAAMLNVEKREALR